MSFQARFVGVCKCGCDETISRDDWVSYTDDNLIVIEGHEYRAGQIKENLTCPKCFLTHAGECF